MESDGAQCYSASSLPFGFDAYTDTQMQGCDWILKAARRLGAVTAVYSGLHYIVASYSSLRQETDSMENKGIHLTEGTASSLLVFSSPTVCTSLVCLSATQHSVNIQSIFLPPNPVATSPQEANVIKIKFREESSNRSIRIKHETDTLQHRIGEALESVG